MLLISYLNGMELIITLIIKSALLLSVAITISWFARRESAAVRHLYLTISMLILFVLPFYYTTLPTWDLNLMTNPFEGASGISSTSKSEATSPGYENENVEYSVYSEISGSSNELENSKSHPLKKTQNILLLIWLSGSLGILFWSVGGRIYSIQVFKKSGIIKDQNFIRNFKEVFSLLKIYKEIKIKVSDRINVPIVVGLFESVIILPTSALKWQPDRLRAILLHELAHVKRNDNIIQFLAQIACALYWFNPLVWILEDRLMMERERACDNYVLQNNIKPSLYAEFLMETSEDLGTGHVKKWSLTGMAEGTDFKDRVLSILDPNAKRNSIKKYNYFKASVLVLLFFIPIVSFTPWSTTDSNTAANNELVDSISANFESPGYSEEDTSRLKITTLETPPLGGELELLLNYLKSPSTSIRHDAAIALGKLKDCRAVPALIASLKDPDNSVRAQAAIALGEIDDRDRRAIGPLVEALRIDSVDRVRVHSVIALGKLGDNRAYGPVLQAAQSDKSERVRRHAINALGNLMDN